MLWGFSVEFWLGTGATILVGVIAAYFTLPRPRRNEIRLSLSGPFSLVSTVYRETPKLRILYNGIDLQGEIAWLEGALQNTGDSDIGPSIVVHFPIVKLGNGAEWQEFTLQDVPQDIEAYAEQVSATDVRIKWTLLKPGEVIPFKAIIKASDAKALWEIRQGKRLSVSARIENVDVKYEKDGFPSASGAKYRMQEASVAVIGGLIMMLLMCGVLIFSQHNRYSGTEIAFSLPKHTGVVYTAKFGDAAFKFETYAGRGGSVVLNSTDLASVRVVGQVPYQPSILRLCIDWAAWISTIGIFLAAWPRQVWKLVRARRAYKSMSRIDALVQA